LQKKDHLDAMTKTTNNALKYLPFTKKPPEAYTSAAFSIT